MFLGEEPAMPDSESEEEAFGNISSSPPTSSESSLFTVIGQPGGRSQPIRLISGISQDEQFVDALSHQGGSVKSSTRLHPPSSYQSVSSSRAPDSRSSLGSALGSAMDHQSLRRDGMGERREAGGGVTTTGGNVTTTSSGSGSKAVSSNWETLVLFAVSLSQLDVMVNMSNVMGNTVWSTKVLKSQGRLSIDSGGYKNMKISARLGGSKLEARGGIIGGSIEMQELNTHVCISEDMGREPEHMVKLHLDIIEARLDYMGSSILMFRFSDLDVSMHDKWQVEAFHRDEHGRPTSMTNSRSLSTFVDGELEWDKLHLMISRSTTPDLVKIIHKLDEFFTQQLTSSKRVLSAFGPITGSGKAKVKPKDEDSWISEIRHHRHWQRVLEHMCGTKLSMFKSTLPDRGTLIGGMISLQGKNISLACFHGINFRSKSWALFTMNDPYISFATEAADVVEENNDPPAKFTHVVQNLSFQLGHNITEMSESRPMAMVCKLSRGHYMPPPFTSVQDWFHYAFSTSEIKDLDCFPQMVRQGSDSQPPQSERGVRRSIEHTHETEIIFILPSLEMHLKTEHMQAEHEPQDGDPKPVVVCSFVTQFDDHIFVAMDAEPVFFLHDLVINYVKEKDRGATRTAAQKSPTETERELLENPTMVLKQDYREFDCKTWHLEPTVRLLSWAGKRIDPVAVDYILQKLGFQHARLTIPKWMQRGCMDPLDKILSMLVDKLLTSLEEGKEERDE